ncbi:MAG: hypothetical protein M3389_09170, partial [Actinomycetota bacterium]|nr:hypothetical protein [Actinomycetota bacterium]
YHERENGLDAGGTPAGRLKEIRDHAGRAMTFSYADGHLTEVRQAVGTAAERRFLFGYEPRGTTDTRTLMTSVTDPNGATTAVRYTPRDETTVEDDYTGRRVEAVTNRRNHETTYAYTRQDDANGRYDHARVTDARGHDTRHQLDTLGRLLELVDARDARMTLAWDDDNNVTELVRAAGTDEAARTTMDYDDHGRLLWTQDALNHRTELAYRYGEGQHASRRTFAGPSGPTSTDDGKGFVVDLLSITNPRGFEPDADREDFTTRFEPDARGNVRAQVTPGGHRAQTDFDGRGQIVRETDEVGNVTSYDEFDPNGMPREKIDPRGNEQGAARDDHRWIFRYDAVGNVLAVTDPRGARTGGVDDERTAYTTKLTYDALDRLREERIPKRSEAGEFVTRTTEYDANGNVEAEVDGNAARTERDYTPTDQVEEVRSPAVRHHGEEGLASEVTQLVYDAEDNLVLERQPLGTKSDAAGDYETERRYDPVGNEVASLRHSTEDRDGDGARDVLAESFAHDLRGNRIAAVDPRGNARCGGAPEDNAARVECRRFTYRYDLADNRRFEVEDPSGEALTTEFVYDANGNQAAQVDPRGTATAAEGDFTSRMEYDGRDLLVARVDAKGRRTEFDLRGDGKLERETRPRGTATAAEGDFETVYDYYATGELRSQTLPKARAGRPDEYGGRDWKVTWQRDAVGNPTTIVDA